MLDAARKREEAELISRGKDAFDERAKAGQKVLAKIERERRADTAARSAAISAPMSKSAVCTSTRGTRSLARHARVDTQQRIQRAGLEA